MGFKKPAKNDGSGDGISITAPVVDATVTSDIYDDFDSCRGIVSTEDGTMDVILTRNDTETPTTEFIFKGFNLYNIGTFVSSTVSVANMKFIW